MNASSSLFVPVVCQPTCPSVSPVIMSSCQTLPVIVKDPTLSSSGIGVLGTRRLLLDLLQLLFLLHVPLFFSKSNNIDIACLLHTCFLFRPVALNALHGLYIYWGDECAFGHFFLCVLSLKCLYIPFISESICV